MTIFLSCISQLVAVVVVAATAVRASWVNQKLASSFYGDDEAHLDSVRCCL